MVTIHQKNEKATHRRAGPTGDHLQKLEGATSAVVHQLSLTLHSFAASDSAFLKRSSFPTSEADLKLSGWK
jgi:hypothetical protein